MKSLLIGFFAVLACGPALAQGPSEFAAVDARLKACVDRDSSNAHQEACLSVVQPIVDTRLNSVYQAWTQELKHPKPTDAKDDVEVLKRLITAERTWITFRDEECSLQSTSALNGTSESVVFSDCKYAMTKARVEALSTFRSAR